MTIPILYSLRQCPYAMRARLAILYAGQTVVLRDVDMINKPKEMLSISPKGTVPVLHFEDTVIEESVDVMLWALIQSDPRNLLYHHDLLQLPLMLELIQKKVTLNLCKFYKNIGLLLAIMTIMKWSIGTSVSNGYQTLKSDYLNMHLSWGKVPVSLITRFCLLFANFLE